MGGTSQILMWYKVFTAVDTKITNLFHGTYIDMTSQVNTGVTSIRQILFPHAWSTEPLQSPDLFKIIQRIVGEQWDLFGGLTAAIEHPLKPRRNLLISDLHWHCSLYPNTLILTPAHWTNPDSLDPSSLSRRAPDCVSLTNAPPFWSAACQQKLMDVHVTATVYNACVNTAQLLQTLSNQSSCWALSAAHRGALCL